MLSLIKSVPRVEPFDRPDWIFASFDGFSAVADTVHGRLISRNDNRMQRYDELALCSTANS